MDSHSSLLGVIYWEKEPCANEWMVERASHHTKYHFTSVNTYGMLLVSILGYIPFSVTFIFRVHIPLFC